MFVLVDDRQGRHQLTGNGPWLVGRHSSAHIQCADDPYCSRRQLELHREGAGLLLVPLSASSHAFIDGTVVTGPTRVAAGSVIKFGRSAFRLEGFRETTVRDDHQIGGGWETVIGRDPGPRGIRVDQPTVSRRHAAFVSRAGGGEIRDLRSTNGTYVNGERISGTVRLGEGDQVRIGRTHFVCHNARLMQVRDMTPRPTLLRTVERQITAR
jgi:pSer/pThr/pTyr-binding forkhead associated (FHA) protein